MANPDRMTSGLYNAVVFGRMVTFALQNLRGKVEGFDEWYEAKQAEMANDPLMRYFRDLRTAIEKKTDRHTIQSVNLESFSPSADMRRFGPPPPNAGTFFMGDQNGGSGWEINRSDGTKDKYYVSIPTDLAEVQVTLRDAPEQYRGMAAPKLLETYLGRMQELVDEAKEKFSGSSASGLRS